MRLIASKVSLLGVAALVLLSPGAVSSARVGVALVPNDPEYQNQGYLNRIRASAAWDLMLRHTLQREVVIAVLDTGVDIDHPDLIGSIWRNTDEFPGDGIDNDGNSFIDDAQGWDFIRSSPDPRPKFEENVVKEAIMHGTVVSGVLAATANNGVGIAGASYNAKIMPLRILDSSGAGSTVVLAQAIDYAVENGADIINLSLVGDISDPRLIQSLNAAFSAGVAVVAASGNQEAEGVNLNDNPRYPVCDSDSVNRVFGVSAVDERNRLAPFSNYGSDCIDISAPGTDIFSTVLYVAEREDYAEYYAGGWGGTSVAAPLVSGTLAVLLKVAPNLTVPELYEAVRTSAQSLRPYNANYDQLGAGLLDMEGAVRAALAQSRMRPARLIVANGSGFEPRVIVKDEEGSRSAGFLAYAPNFLGGVRVAAGDVDGDGATEIVSVPRSSGGPHVRVFTMEGALKSQFMAFDPSFRGGLSIATGDINNDKRDEIIVGITEGGEPIVRVYSFRGDLLSEFTAYHSGFRGGVSLATGDTDLDGVAEIVTAPASAGGPHIRIFDSAGALKGQFMAFDSSERGGYSVAIGNVNFSAGNEILVAQRDHANPQVRIFDSRASEINRFLVFQENVAAGQHIDLDSIDSTGDGQAEIIVYTPLRGVTLRVFDYLGQLLDQAATAPTDSAGRQLPAEYAYVRL